MDLSTFSLSLALFLVKIEGILNPITCSDLTLIQSCLESPRKQLPARRWASDSSEVMKLEEPSISGQMHSVSKSPS